MYGVLLSWCSMWMYYACNGPRMRGALCEGWACHCHHIPAANVPVSESVYKKAVLSSDLFFAQLCSSYQDVGETGPPNSKKLPHVMWI